MRSGKILRFQLEQNTRPEPLSTVPARTLRNRQVETHASTTLGTPVVYNPRYPRTYQQKQTIWADHESYVPTLFAANKYTLINEELPNSSVQWCGNHLQVRVVLPSSSHSA